MKQTTLIWKQIFVAVFFIILTSSTALSQIVLFNADFQTTTGDNAWINETTNTRGDWVRQVGGNTYVRPNRWFNYRSGVLMGLVSPAVDLSSYENLTLDLTHFYNTEGGRDGMNVQYSINNGPWLVLGDVASGYYNDTDVDGILDNTDGWSGNNTGGNAFTNAPTLDMSAFDPNLNGAANVRFKVVFGTDNGTQDAGVAFDNFVITGYVTGGC